MDERNASPPRIGRLPPALANQIAAGEVIERPASVVKELVENSLDAGATQIVIDVVRGGLQSIRVTDDGHGIHPDDLALALERHATSKVRSQADLDGIRSLGFRGEALPSIASIAALRLCSRVAGHRHGFCVVSTPGAESPVRKPDSHTVGTTVEVTGLFHDFPARRKFLRSERTEYLHVLDVVQRLALSRAQMALTFSHDGNTVLQCPAGIDAGQRAAAVFGRAFQREAVGVDFTAGGMRLWGWLGGPGQTRSQSDRQFLFLNGRTIRDRLVSHAIRSAIGDLVPPGRFPVFILHLEMDARAADVNVHPTKHEVRFRQARDVHDFIFAALRSGLGAGTEADPSVPVQLVQSALLAGVAEHTHPGYSGLAPAAVAGTHAPFRPRAAEGSARPRLGWPIAMIEGRFVLTGRDGKWLLVNLAALQRLAVRARLFQQLAAGSIRRRPLLVPEEMEMSAVDTPFLEANQALLANCGLQLDPVAPRRFAVREIPQLLPDVDAAGLVRDVLTALRACSSAAGRPAAVITAMLEHCLPPTTAPPGPDTLAEWLHGLEHTGLDLAADAHRGLWGTLARADLERLLQSGR